MSLVVLLYQSKLTPNFSWNILASIPKLRSVTFSHVSDGGTTVGVLTPIMFVGPTSQFELAVDIKERKAFPTFWCPTVPHDPLNLSEDKTGFAKSINFSSVITYPAETEGKNAKRSFSGKREEPSYLPVISKRYLSLKV